MRLEFFYGECDGHQFKRNADLLSVLTWDLTDFVFPLAQLVI